jgi:WD40 repeat protein
MKDRTQLIELAHQNPVRLEGHERDVTAIATFPDGVRIATGSGDKTIRIWRLEDDRTEEVGAGEDSRGTCHPERELSQSANSTIQIGSYGCVILRLGSSSQGHTACSYFGRFP